MTIEEIITLMKAIYPAEKHDRLGVMLRLDGSISIYYKSEFQRPDVINVFLSADEFKEWLILIKEEATW